MITSRTIIDLQGDIGKETSQQLQSLRRGGQRLQPNPQIQSPIFLKKKLLTKHEKNDLQPPTTKNKKINQSYIIKIIF